MNKEELTKYRENFYENIQKGFFQKHMMELKDYKEILKNTIKEEKISVETSNKIFVYMGSYAMLNGHATLTYNNDKDLVYKKYKDLETGNSVTVNKASINAFEKENKVIFPVVEEYTESEYMESYDMVRYVYFEKLLTSDEEESYRLIKRLTPSK